MFDFGNWQIVNENYLANSLEWLRLQLQAAGGVDGKGEGIQQVAMPPGEGEYRPALEVLATRFGLSDFEKRILLLCVAMEFDTRFPALCASAQQDATKPFPTLALCFSVFSDGAWDVLSPDRPLRHFKLIEIERQPQVPLTSTPLRADERIVSYLKGLNYVDERLALLLSPLDVDALVELPLSQQSIVQQIQGELQQGGTDDFPLIQLLGPEREDKRAIAARVADEIGIRLYCLAADAIPQSIHELDTFLRLWQRECQLMPLGMYIDTADGTDGQTSQALGRCLRRLNGVTFCDSLDRQADMASRCRVFDVAKPTSQEQRSAWCTRLAADASEIAKQLAGQFDLNLGRIHRVAESTPNDPYRLAHELWQRCRQCTRPKLDDLAKRIDAKATWRDIVLPDEQLDLLKQVAAQVRNRGKVLDDWGFRSRANRGLGVTALFGGESGTGKTMAAEVIANDLQLDLYRIDLSSVINKYIGETEKNLRRLFDAAESGGVILFFDEADALFGKRSEVKDSHDRFANIEVNYLLQRMESYRGLAILATNNKSALDTAFMRRLRFVIDFRFPDKSQRKQIWQRAFPDRTPVFDINYHHLAKMRLTGGNISNIALNAAFAAANDRPHVDMPAILAATKSELNKSHKPLNLADFQWSPTREAMS